MPSPQTVVDIRHLDDSCGTIASRWRISTFWNNYTISETIIADIVILTERLPKQSYVSTASLQCTSMNSCSFSSIPIIHISKMDALNLTRKSFVVVNQENLFEVNDPVFIQTRWDAMLLFEEVESFEADNRSYVCVTVDEVQLRIYFFPNSSYFCFSH